MDKITGSIITVYTANPFALDSDDFLKPYGSRVDNHTQPMLIRDLERYFDRKYSTLDLGCAGGQFIADLYDRGHIAVGLDGSDYPIKHNQPNWARLYGKAFFNCDITKPFTITKDGNQLEFDVITAWDVLEHIHSHELPMVFDNLIAHMTNNSIFIGTICCVPSVANEKEEPAIYHRSVFDQATWLDVLATRFRPMPSPSTYWVRDDPAPTILRFCVRLKEEIST